MQVNTVEELLTIARAHRCRSLLVKQLAANDNSKNQIYLGGDFLAINLIPFSGVSVDSTSVSGSKRERLKADISFGWVGETINYNPANLILYPRYPEVRLSGILMGHNPSEEVRSLIRSREEGRLLFLGVSDEGKVVGHCARISDPIGRDFEQLKSTGLFGDVGVFFRASTTNSSASSQDLIKNALRPIINSGWIRSKRLDRAGEVISCEAPNCGGYTLEAELGIIPNGYSAPDYEGWEVKQYGVRSFSSRASQPITLMTPEPDGGLYRELGVNDFVRKYGYADRGIEDRLNFGGVHKFGSRQSRTQLSLFLDGYESENPKKWSATGAIILLDDEENIAASWSFEGLLKHWQRKHAKAVYLRSILRRTPSREYQYSARIQLGVDTSFPRFLRAISEGEIYYDPGIKVENATSRNPRNKRRSQFRVKSNSLGALYNSFTDEDLLEEP